MDQECSIIFQYIPCVCVSEVGKIFFLRTLFDQKYSKTFNNVKNYYNLIYYNLKVFFIVFL